jgi:hypothetical protein
VRRVDGRDRHRLFAAEWRTRGAHQLGGRVGGCLVGNGRRRHQAALDQCAHDSAPVVTAFSQGLAGQPAVAEALQQFTLARRAVQFARGQGGRALGRREPVFGGGARCGAFAREFGQRRGQNFPERVVVVLRRPFRELHEALVEHRRLVEHLEHGLEFFARQFGAVGVGDHEAHFSLAPEGHAHARTDLRQGRRVARRKVIEQPAQRRIERDAQYHGRRQGDTFRVFHSACG